MIDISVSGLVKEFEVGSKILDGLTFQVDTGERVGLLGPNGCGKTTLLRILTGALDCDEGEVSIAPGKRVGLISQIPVYPVGYTVEDVLDAAFAPLRAMEGELFEIYKDLHRHPELGFYENRTAQVIAQDTKVRGICSQPSGMSRNVDGVPAGVHDALVEIAIDDVITDSRDLHLRTSHLVTR